MQIVLIKLKCVSQTTISGSFRESLLQSEKWVFKPRFVTEFSDVADQFLSVLVKYKSSYAQNQRG